jgi:pimeloyl-ACP methyl ester carboxylesterase
MQRVLHAQARAAAPYAGAALSTTAGRRRATELLTVNFEHIPVELLAHQQLAVATAPAAEAMIARGLEYGWTLDAGNTGCPVRVVWGTDDALLPWPSAAARYRSEWLPHAEWVVLDGVGHCPQLDVPLEAAQLILGLTAPG